jgi:hypothetical protein
MIVRIGISLLIEIQIKGQSAYNTTMIQTQAIDNIRIRYAYVATIQTHGT